LRGIPVTDMRTHTHTWFPLEQVLCLNGCDLRDGGEDMSAACRCPLQTIPMVDLSIPRLLIHVELRQRGQFQILNSTHQAITYYEVKFIE
jgi:hypothetical protein